MALALPSLFAGYAIDDHMMRVAAGRVRLPCVPSTRWDLFVFIADDPACRSELMAAGILPWWTAPGLHVAFFRPISSATHALDHLLWPDEVWLMHAQSLLWFGLMLGAAAAAYRAFHPGPVAAVAALLYSVDDAHGVAAGWLSNRNALLACAFGMSALVAHARWRQSGWRPGAVAAGVLLALSLLSAEAGVATCAYLFAYAAFLDRGSWRSRFVSLVPYGVLVVVWQAASRWLGYGAYGSDLYVDPANAPGAFATAVVTRLPVLLFASLGLPVADLWPLLHDSYRSILLAAAMVGLALIAVVVTPLLRRDAHARFFALGMVLAAIPVSATFPSDRLLTFVDVGAMGLVASFLCAQHSALAARVLGALWLAIHIGLAALLLPVRSLAMGNLGGQLERTLMTLGGAPGLAGRDVVFVNPPTDFFPVYLPVLSQLEGKPQPEHTRPLALGQGPITLTREDERTLVLSRQAGLFSEAGERLLRSSRMPMTPGERIPLPGMTITVTEVTARGLPRAVRFVFPKALEDPSYLWVAWTAGPGGTFRPPEIGQTATLPAASFGNVFAPATSEPAPVNLEPAPRVMKSPS